MAIYIDTQGSGAQVVAGLDGLFSFNFGSLSYRRRRSTQVIHLGKAKPDMVEKISTFKAATNGTVCDIGEFAYISPGQTLRITNLDACSGLVEDPELGYAIPIKFIPREQVIMTTLHQPPEFIS